MLGWDRKKWIRSDYSTSPSVLQGGRRFVAPPSPEAAVVLSLLRDCNAHGGQSAQKRQAFAKFHPIFFTKGLTTVAGRAIMRSIKHLNRLREEKYTPGFVSESRRRCECGTNGDWKWASRGPCQRARHRRRLIKRGRDADPLSGCTVCWYGVSGSVRRPR